MAFEGLSSRLQEITRKLNGKARITESDLKEMLREVKLALLEADVNYKIVKEYLLKEKDYEPVALEGLDKIHFDKLDPSEFRIYELLRK